MKKITLFIVIAMLLMSVSAVFADQTPDYHEYWDGRGSDSKRCGYYDEFRDPEIGWIHWVFSTKGASTDAKLFLMDKAGVQLGEYEPAPPLNANVWHFYTPYFDLSDLKAKIELYGGMPGKGGGLVISDYCPGEEEVLLDVDKTAYTSFKRTHDWNITKKVETEKKYMKDGFPKIWLYTDGSGNEKATWTIDVTYLGYVDSHHKVWGDITVENIGKKPAKIVEIKDWLIPFDEEADPIEVEVDCDMVLFPYELLPGQKIECKYHHMFDPDVAFEGYNYVEVLTDEDKKFYDDADIIWGDPDPDLHAVVDIWDESDLFGKVKLGTLDAYALEKDQVTTFTYHKDFAYADYTKCGPNLYENVAKVVSGEFVLDWDDATLKVNVQCLIFKGETAWAANGHTPGSLRYTEQGNWATYVQYKDVKKITTLFAGQTIPVGKVYFSKPTADGKVKITVTLDSPWMYEKVKENLKVQHYTKAPSGNPAPGQFKWKKTCDDTKLSCSIMVPKAKFYGVHANVGWWMPDPKFGP
jgi:hypothetical protein